MIEVHKYPDATGRIPFDEWLEGLRDQRARARILIRIRRLSLGLKGDWKTVGDGVRELRIQEGRGYRVYYAWWGGSVLLLWGGDKRAQRRDIETAKRFWRRCHE